VSTAVPTLQSDVIVRNIAQIATAVLTVLLFAFAPRAAAQSTAFDGNWWVTMGAQDFKNPYNRGLSHAFEYHFPATSLTATSTGSAEPGKRRVITNSTGLSSPTVRRCYRRAVLPENKSTAKDSFLPVLHIRTQ
jgi:hypothetical protein